jgi:hypothetical protein
LRLLRREVEELMSTTHNDAVHRQKRAKAELLRVHKELKQLLGQPRPSAKWPTVSDEAVNRFNGDGR